MIPREPNACKWLSNSLSISRRAWSPAYSSAEKPCLWWTLTIALGFTRAMVSTEAAICWFLIPDPWVPVTIEPITFKDRSDGRFFRAIFFSAKAFTSSAYVTPAPIRTCLGSGFTVIDLKFLRLICVPSVSAISLKLCPVPIGRACPYVFLSCTMAITSWWSRGEATYLVVNSILWAQFHRSTLFFRYPARSIFFFSA